MAESIPPTVSTTVQALDVASARGRVVAGVDCSVGSADVLRAAGEVAGRLDADLEAVFVYSPRIDPAFVSHLAMSKDDVRHDLHNVLSEVVRDTFGDDQPSGLSLSVYEGDPAATLLARSQGADLLVVGCHGRGVLTGLMVNSVAAKCVEHARCPVLVAHPRHDVQAPEEGAVVTSGATSKTCTAPARQSSGRVVVGVDGSPESKAALRWAARLAGAMDLGIDAVITWDPPIYFGGFGPGYLPPHWTPRADYTGYLNDAIDEVFGDHRPRDLRPYAEEGHAARRLLAHTKHAALLVLGNRGHAGLASLLLGSVSVKCVKHATCPVLVIHVPPVVNPPLNSGVAGEGTCASDPTDQDAATSVPASTGAESAVTARAGAS
jgi:nucleotide-binding universal stress UspA family protein